jgi:hypothetical protein
MKNMTLAVCLAMCVAGCGSGRAANNVVLQGGQWEFVVTPDNGGITMDIDANLPGTNFNFGGTTATIVQPSQIGVVGSTAPIFCTPFNINGTINGNGLSGKMNWGDTTQHFASFTGDLAADGQLISNGTYLGGACSVSDGPGTPGPEFKGTFMGRTIAPVNGTYSGTLNSSLSATDLVTFVITQNADFSLNMSGMSVENSVSTTFMPAAQPLSSAVMGATVYLNGKAMNVNGSNDFTFSGHLNPTATQLTVATMNVGNETVSGTLTKQ